MEREPFGVSSLLADSLAGVDVGVWEWHPATDEVFWTAHVERIYGFEADEFSGTFAELAKRVHPEDRPAWEEGLRACAESGRPHDLAFRVISKQGGLRWTHAVGTAESDDRGQVTRVVGTVIDITDAKRDESTIAHFFEQAMNLHLIAGLDGTIQHVNRGWERILGYSEKELAQTSFLELVHPDDRAQTLDEMSALAEGKTTFYFENRYRHKEGAYRTLAWSATASLDRQLIFAVASDMTDSKRAQSQVQDTLSQLQLAVDTAKLGFWRMNLATGRLDWNDQLLEIHGLRREQFDNTIEAWRSRVLSEDIGQADERFEKVLAGGYVNDVEFRIRRPDGEIRHIRASGAAIKDENGAITELIGINYDITDIRQKDERLRQAATVFSNTIEGVTITELSGGIIDVNDAFTEITGYARDEVIGRTPAILKSGRHDAEFYRGMWRSLAETGQWRGEIWNRRKDGTIYPQLLTISAVREADGKATGYVGVFSDITQMKRAQERLDYLAHHDPLTDLPNRLLLNERLKQRILHAARRQAMLAVIFVDLDRFKTINDSMGHMAGDLILKEVAARLRAGVRADDTVARISGDEFIVLMEVPAGIEQATTAVGIVMDAFLSPITIGGADIQMTASTGIALYPQDGQDAATLLRNADTAMYRAKADGRNSFQFYNKEMTASAFEHLFLENALRKALSSNEFVLFYQPQVDMFTGACVGLEALLRWAHPDQGMIKPDRFIPIAEQSGLIREMGLWMLHQACSQAKAWLEQGIGVEKISINVAGPQIQDTAFSDKIDAVLRATGFPASHLTLEVTESFLMEGLNRSIPQLQQLREKGIEIAIDDFGTGYSSLSYLKRLPIDVLKIDQSFIHDIPEDPNDMAISAAVIEMARQIGLKTVAEGVETTAQADFLQANGCRLAQGFLFSRPLPADEVPGFLEGRVRA